MFSYCKNKLLKNENRTVWPERKQARLDKKKNKYIFRKGTDSACGVGDREPIRYQPGIIS